jgi:hypothetical protein
MVTDVIVGIHCYATMGIKVIGEAHCYNNGNLDTIVAVVIIFE